MLKDKKLVLPYPSTALRRGPQLFTDGADLVVSIDFADEKLHSVSLRFVRQRAFRKRSEIYCTRWHVEGTFDTVCEIKGSDCVDELSSAAPSDWRNRWVMRHFMTYLDGLGCLEVVAESVSLEQ